MATAELIHGESIELTAFYRDQTVWPQQEAEFASIATRVARLCGVPFAALSSSAATSAGASPGSNGSGKDSPEKLGIGALGALRNREPILREVIRKHLKTRVNVEGDLQEHEISSDAMQGVEIGFLTFSRISGDVWLGPSQREGRVEKEFGWLVLGSERALEPKQELLLLGISRRLSELAEIAHLESTINTRSHFLSIASHELKTPLTSIYGILQLQERMLRLKKEEPEGAQLERQHSFLKMVIRQVERLNELIDGLLDVSRIQNGRFMVEPTETDVAVVLRETFAGRLSVIAQEAGVRLDLDTPQTLMAWVDPVRVEEVITNLVMNAIRFSPEGGSVCVRLQEDGGAFRLVVRDQGPSVPMEDRERIFQPFERAQRTSRLGGLGLGLFISRQIAQLHGGNVSIVESIPGKGNVLEAHFPMRDISVISA